MAPQSSSSDNADAQGAATTGEGGDWQRVGAGTILVSSALVAKVKKNGGAFTNEDLDALDEHNGEEQTKWHFERARASVADGVRSTMRYVITVTPPAPCPSASLRCAWRAATPRRRHMHDACVAPVRRVAGNPADCWQWHEHGRRLGPAPHCASSGHARTHARTPCLGTRPAHAWPPVRHRVAP